MDRILQVSVLALQSQTLVSQIHCHCFRSIGLHREAEMIEQQLKMKQTPGQVTMPAGGTIVTFTSLVRFIYFRFD